MANEDGVMVRQLWDIEATEFSRTVLYRLHLTLETTRNIQSGVADRENVTLFQKAWSGNCLGWEFIIFGGISKNM